MHIIDDRRICGKADGAKYRKAILPNMVQKGDTKVAECKEGFKPCIENSASTTCYCDPEMSESECKAKGGVSKEQCPITDI